jgi:hypothetical protein|nr:MAG TPA: hypothetical protein [Caudoviricetes sp.]
MCKILKTYHEACQNPESRRAFEEAAMHEAKARLKKADARNGFNSEAEVKAYLRNSEEADLIERAYWATEAAIDNYTQSQNPHIAPETSFELLVGSYIQEEIARVLDEVVSETVEAENAQTEQRLGR